MVGSPALYYHSIPDSFLFEPQTYIASDINLSESKIQVINVNRTIHSPFRGDWTDELFLQCVDGCAQTLIVAIDGTSSYSLDKGQTFEYAHDLTDLELVEGTYIWYFSIRGNFPYNVKRTFQFTSNEFEVYT